MYRKQLIQLLQFVLARIVVRALVVFVSEKSFIDFILQYRLYLLIVSVSYRYYYSIEYESDKKYNFIRKSLISSLLYLSITVFSVDGNTDLVVSLIKLFTCTIL